MLVVIIIVFLVAVISLSVISRAFGETPSLFGLQIFRVTTGSMEPDLMVGDVILTQKVDDIKTLNEGDIISFYAIDSAVAGKIVTHRVVKAPYTQNGVTFVVTKGTASTAEDSPVTQERLVGKMLFKIPYLDRFFSIFLSPWGLLIFIFLLILVFANEIINIIYISVGVNKKQKVNLDEIIANVKSENQDNENLILKEKNYKDEKKTDLDKKD